MTRYRLTTYREGEHTVLAQGSYDAIQAVLRLYGHATDVTKRGEDSAVRVAKYFCTRPEGFDFIDLEIAFEGYPHTPEPQRTNSYAEPIRFDIWDPANMAEESLKL